MEERRYKVPSESRIEMTELVLPNDTNLLDNLLGGRLMHWIDIAGALAASKHSNRIVATASVDSLDFRHPARKGEMVMLRAKLTWVGNTSMEVRVDVYCENLQTGDIVKTNKAYLTFVALDNNGNPVKVPGLKPETEEEIWEFDCGKLRRERRLSGKNKC